MPSMFDALNFGGGGSNLSGAGGNIGGAVSDLFAAEGDRAEASNYRSAAKLARQNEQYTELSTAIKNMQADRQIFQTIGEQGAAVAASGFATGGSAGDLLRSSVSQGALTHAVLSEQGLIQEKAYEEQAQSYDTMAAAKDNAAMGADIGAAIKGVTAVAQIFGF